MTDLISREAAIDWHIARRDEAKANAGRCRSTDEEAACRYLEEAILHGDAINAFRALPAQAHVVKARPLEEWHEDMGHCVWWCWEEGDWLGEAAWIGRPIDCDWPDYHTHFTPHPEFPPSILTENA